MFPQWYFTLKLFQADRVAGSSLIFLPYSTSLLNFPNNSNWMCYHLNYCFLFTNIFYLFSFLFLRNILCWAFKK